jgi:hypothetical protein
MILIMMMDVDIDIVLMMLIMMIDVDIGVVLNDVGYDIDGGVYGCMELIGI